MKIGQARLRMHVMPYGETVMVRPAGRLDPRSSAHLRDGLLKCVAADPAGVLVDLADLTEPAEPANDPLSVFGTVWSEAAAVAGPQLVLARPTAPVRRRLDDAGIALYVATYPTLVEAMGAVAREPARRRERPRARLRVANALDGPRKARSFIREFCERWSLHDEVDDAVLVGGELVTNTVLHTYSDAWLRIDLHARGLTLAVRDRDPRRPVVRTRAARGWGLLVVAGLTVAHGCMPAEGGKVVWATLPVTDPGRSPEPPRHTPRTY